MTASRAINRPALAASLLATLLVLVLQASGPLDRLEGATLTLRFEFGRLSPVPLDERITLVAIDDSSEQTIGRWPWPRSLQARAIDEITRAGPRTVAFDILYTEPSDDPAEDEALAAAIGRCRGVVGANVDPDELLDELWTAGRGPAMLARLLDTLGHDLELPAEQVVERASLIDPWRQRFLDKSFAFRQLAAWTRLQELRAEERRPESLQALLEALGLPTSFLTGTSAVRRMVARLWQRDESWQALAHCMAPATGEPSPKEGPPILVIARAAGGAGMVHGQADPGGQMRRVKPAVTTPVGDCLQLGLLAAADFLGADPKNMRVEPGRVLLGDRVLPAHEGRVVIDWPTSTFQGFPVLRGGGAPRTAVPLGALADLAEQRRVQERQEQTYRELARIVAEILERPTNELESLPIPEAVRKDARESIDFMYGSVLERGLEALPADATDALRENAKRFLEWAALEQAVLLGREALAKADEQARAALAGKLVFVGFISTGALADMINSPYGPRTPGVFVHAAVASMALEGRGVRFAPGWVAPALTLVLGIFCGVIAATTGAGRGSGAAILLLLLYGFGAWLSFALLSLVLPVVAPMGSGFLSWVAGVTLVAVVNQRERARITRQFRARVSPQLVERLAANPNALSVGGLERQVTILFGDLAGFTTLSENLGGAEVVRTLNRYMGALTRELTARRAYVNKFLGDGLLAFWSAFGEEPEQQRLSAEAARACQDAVLRLGEDPQFKDRPPIRLRLGIATGKVVVGDCGAPPELNDYTVIGDAVNLASRLESANKQFGTRILMDGNTARGVLAAPDAPALLALGRVIVVGQSVPVELYTVLDPEDPEGWAEAIGAGVAAFASGDRARAIDAWREIDRRFDHPPIAKPFLAALADPEDPCDGVLRLRAK